MYEETGGIRIFRRRALRAIGCDNARIRIELAFAHSEIVFAMNASWIKSMNFL